MRYTKEQIFELAKHFAVFPIQRGKKIPLSSSKGVLDATQNPNTLEVWTNKFLGTNWAIHPGATNLIVVDCDYKKRQDPLPIEAELSETLLIKTPNGRHYYYRLPVNAPSWSRSSSTGLLPGLDLRCDNTYVVAPGSVVDGKEYKVEHNCEIAEVPAAILQLLKVRHEKAQEALRNKMQVRQVNSDSALKACLAYVDKIPHFDAGGGEGERNFLLAARVAQNGFALPEGDVAYVLEHCNARANPPFSEREIAHKVKQVFGSPDPSGQPFGHLLERGGGSESFALELAVASIEAEKNPPTEAGPQQRKEESKPVLTLGNKKITEVYNRNKHKDTRYWALLDGFADLHPLFEAYAVWACSRSLLVQPGLILGAFLSACGVWAARHWETEGGLQSQHWGCGLGDSSCGKGTSVALFRDLIFDYAPRKPERAIKTEAALVVGLELASASNYCKPFALDEYGEFLKLISAKSGHGTGIKKTLTELYTNNGDTYHYASSVTQNNGDTIVLAAPAVPFWAASNETSIRQAFKHLGTEDGFLGRHTFYAALDESLQQLEDNPDHKAKEKCPQALVDQIAKVRQAFEAWRNEQPRSSNQTRREDPIYLYQPKVLPTVGPVEAIWTAHRRASRTRGNLPGVDKNLYGRLTEQAIRIAIGLAVFLDPEAPVVTPAIARFCCAVVDQSVQTITQCLQSGTDKIDRDDEEEKCNRVLAALRKRSGDTAAEVSWAAIAASTRRVGKRKEVLEVLERLEQEGKVRKSSPVGYCGWALTKEALG